MKLFLSAIFLLALQIEKLNAQYPYTQKINYPAQLPTQVIYDMLSDKSGYLWLATDKGLFRFNGRSFTQIPFNKTSLQAVSYLQQDPQGTIWCMNFYKEIFYYKNDTLYNFTAPNAQLKTAGSVLNFVVTRNDVWIASLSTLFQFNKKTGFLKQKVKPPVDGIGYFTNRGEQIIACAADGWTYQYPEKNNSWKKIPELTSNMRMTSTATSVVAAQVGSIRSAGFKVENNKVELIPQLDLPSNIIVYHFSNTGENELWICSQSGAYSWDVSTGKTSLIFPDQSVTDIVKDYQGNYWISTLDNGLFICPSLQNKLYKMNSIGAIDNITKIAAVNKNTIITGSSKGAITLFNQGNGKQLSYHLPISREIEFIQYDAKNELIYTNRGLLKKGEPSSLLYFDFSKGTAIDPKGNILIATFNKAYVRASLVNRTQKKLCNNDFALYKKHTELYLQTHLDSIAVFRWFRTNTVVASKDNLHFWMAYADDLYKYSYVGSNKIIRSKKGAPIIAKVLLEIDNQTLIAGTTNEGLFIIKNDTVVKQYHKENGLKSNTIKQCAYLNGIIWVQTNESLETINIKTGNIQSVLDEFGLASLQLNDFIVNEERFFLATNSGVLVKEYTRKQSNNTIFFPQLTATANGIHLRADANLKHNQNNIGFTVDALHFKSPSKLQYHFRLIGLDTNWKKVGYATSTITFGRLNPGKYEFQIQATDEDLIYTSAIKKFSFKISSPFWQKWWFVLLALLAIAMLGFILLKLFTKRLLKQQMLKEQLYKSQLVAIRSQMNPHFMYNVLNTAQGLLYDNRKNEVGNLLGNFSDLMRKTLQSSERQLQTLEVEIENLRLYLELEKARFDQDFIFTIILHNPIDASTLLIPSLLLQPFAENAVKHGLMHKNGSKQLTIGFEKANGGIRVQIDDNGIGRKQSMQINQRNKSKPNSFATKAISERIQLFNRLYKNKIEYTVIDKIDEAKQSLGTLIILVIPDYSGEQIKL